GAHSQVPTDARDAAFKPRVRTTAVAREAARHPAAVQRAAQRRRSLHSEEPRAMGNRRTAPLNVVFIGNSFTARNNLPALVAQLAAARGKRMEHRLLSAGGASLRTHWNAGEALKAIQEGRYERVVLQEQSTLPVKNPKRMRENVRLFDEAINAVGAKT